MRLIGRGKSDAISRAPLDSGLSGFLPFTLFAAEDGPHISLKAESITSIGGLTITNAMIYGVVVAVILIFIGVYVGKRTAVKPGKGVVAIAELLVEFLVDMLSGIFNSRHQAYKYAPVFGTFFVFIIFNNLAGLIPVVGWITVGSSPLFRPFTADLNGTIALAVAAILLVQFYSIKESGVKGHVQHYFTDQPWNPINFFIGILEIFGELTRVISLALRLFFNTAMGEILIAIFAFIGQDVATATLLPIVVFEVLVAFIQAYVFTVLAATYLALALHHDEHEHSFDQSPTHSDPEQLIAQELHGVS